MSRSAIDYFNNNNSRFTAYFPSQPAYAGTRKAKTFWILMKQEMMISRTICKSFAPCSRQIATPAPYQSILRAAMLFLTPNQRCQSTADIC